MVGWRPERDLGKAAMEKSLWEAADQSQAHSPLHTDALGWAAELHNRQRRKAKTVPYISHLIAISALAREDGGDEPLAIAALLHDAIEDCGVSQQQIAQRFGERVAQIVADCTDTSDAVAANGEKEPWLLRKTAPSSICPMPTAIPCW